METVTALDGVAERMSRGEPLSPDDAAAVLAAKDIIAIGMLADDCRRRLRGSATTFVRVLESHLDAPLSQVPAGASAGEVRIVGAPSSAGAAIHAARQVAAAADGIPVTGFSLGDLVRLVDGDFGGLCARLRDAGLTGVAEVPLDLLADAEAAVRAARDAGLDVLRLTVDDAPAGERLTLLERARRLQETAGGFRAFAPLPRRISLELPTTGYEDVKLVALARLLVTNIDSIQVDWPLYGPKLAQVALTMGADDVDGIAAVDPGTLGARRAPLEEILRNIRAAGLEPVERDARFARRAAQPLTA